MDNALEFNIDGIGRNRELINKIHRAILKRSKIKWEICKIETDGDLLKIWNYRIDYTSLGIFIRKNGNMWFVYDWSRGGDKATSTEDISERSVKRVLKIINKEM